MRRSKADGVTSSGAAPVRVEVWRTDVLTLRRGKGRLFVRGDSKVSYSRLARRDAIQQQAELGHIRGDARVLSWDVSNSMAKARNRMPTPVIAHPIAGRPDWRLAPCFAAG